MRRPWTRSAAARRPARLRLAKLLAIAAVFGISSLSCERSEAPDSGATPSRDATRAAEAPIARNVRHVLDQRCVVCHSCYDAPCQLNLGSNRGLERGASKQPVYNPRRLLPQKTTRLGIDASDEQGWRAVGFHDVLEGATGPADGLMRQMLALGKATHFTPGERLPDEFPLDINRALSCPTHEEFEDYAENAPHGGMPYGLASIDERDATLLSEWLDAGAPALVSETALDPEVEAQVARWETFLNGPTLEEKITARYLYEHWFVTHLYFRSAPTGPFFRAVRSSTPPGRAIVEIATRRPFDDPGDEPFWYRLAPVSETIVHKTHVVYPLDPARMERLERSFLDGSWTATKLPAYGRKHGSNPFVTFAELPARARYQYLLDDARHFIATFIRGPVCHGQVAVDVIEDHFWVSFLDPDHDLSVTDPTFLERAKKLLDLPAESGSLAIPGAGMWADHAANQVRYLELRRKAYAATDPEKRGPSLAYLWDGDGHDRDALLTVFRHFDNATVERGLWGVVPENAWVIDYPIFERIYYDLVAGFDVFGNLPHQVATRLYMDHLRMQSENNLLAFLPEKARKPLRDGWYLGATDEVHQSLINRPKSKGHGTQIDFQTTNYVAELFELLRARDPEVAGPDDLLNRCRNLPCRRAGTSDLEGLADAELQKLADRHAPWVVEMPEVTWLRVHADDDPSTGHAYTLTHDRAHTNVASMFGEEERLQPALDRVTILSGTIGSYPNFFFDVAVGEMAEFASALGEVENPAEFERFVSRFGVRRTDPRFWSLLDWFHADYARRMPTEAGIIDLGRYKNL